MADAESRVRGLVVLTTLASAGYTALKNTYFSGGVSSWFGGGEVQPLNPELGDTPFEPIQGEPVITSTPTPVPTPTPILIPKEAQGFSLLTPDQSPTEPFASFGPSGGNFGDSTKKVIEEVLKGGAKLELPPVDPLTQTPVMTFDASNAFSQPISLPSDAPPLFQPIDPQIFPQVQVPEISQNFSMDLPSANISNNTYVPPEVPLNPTQGWLESVASYDYSSALTNPYNYLSAMTAYFTLSNIKAAYDNTGILGAVKQSTKEVVKRAVSVYAAEAISEGVAVYLNPGDPIQKEATKQNVKDVIAVTVGVVMPLVSLGMSRYRAKNEADRIKHQIQMEIDRQEKLAIEYATSLFRAGVKIGLATIAVPQGLDATVANVMLQHELQQRQFSQDFTDIVSKLPDISFGAVKEHMPKDMEFERAMLIVMLEKQKRKELAPKVVIKEAATTVTPPTTYTPSAASSINTNNRDVQTQTTEQEAALKAYWKRHGK